MFMLLRKELFLTQKEVAKYLGIKQSTYSDLEQNNIYNIKGEYIIKLCILYNISTDYMLGISTMYKELENRDKLIDKFRINKEYLRYLEDKMKLSNLDIKDIDTSRTRENINKLLNIS